MPMTQHRLLDGREGISEFTETSLGRWRYVTAYRRLPDGDILGAQAIGMRTAWFNPNHQSKPKTDPQPDIEFHDWKAFHLSLPSKT